MMNPETYFRAFEQLEAERQEQPKTKRRGTRSEASYSVRQLSSGCFLYELHSCPKEIADGTHGSSTRPSSLSARQSLCGYRIERTHPKLNLAFAAQSAE